MITYRASKMEAVVVDNDTASIFVRENHRSQDARGAGMISIGLRLNDELYAVVQFCNPRTALMQRTYSTELLRLAFKKGVRIHGGASKLIRYYIENFKPADFFTYQDTTGELTEVYRHAGMKLVREGLNRTKEYLVAPGKSLETAERKDVLSIAYAVRYGPDSILGVSLGEVFDETGKRKSNKRLFIEELGWHIETTTGDRIYEWVDPDRTYYTYRIGASDSKKYYHGVSHVKKANATMEDCLNDGYYGSGGVKFRNWKKRHSEYLTKEITGIHSSRLEAFETEAALVDLSDPLCLNSSPGGIRNRIPGKIPILVTTEVCDTHGATAHVNGNCSKCSVANRTVLKNCPKHGLTKHQGRSCYACVHETMNSKKLCPIHGEVNFVGDSCRICLAEKSHMGKECSVHGLTPHHGDQCVKCQAEARTGFKECPIHGFTKFQGNSCYQCNTNGRLNTKFCEIHGETIFSGNSCSKCLAKTRYQLKECPIHGMTNHTRKRGCVKCGAGSSVSEKNCSIHGLTTHNGNTCARCNAQARMKPNRAFGGISDEELAAKLIGRKTSELAKEFGVASSTVNLAKRRLLKNN